MSDDSARTAALEVEIDTMAEALHKAGRLASVCSVIENARVGKLDSLIEAMSQCRSEFESAILAMGPRK